MNLGQAWSRKTAFRQFDTKQNSSAHTQATQAQHCWQWMPLEPNAELSGLHYLGRTWGFLLVLHTDHSLQSLLAGHHAL